VERATRDRVTAVTIWAYLIAAVVLSFAAYGAYVAVRVIAAYELGWQEGCNLNVACRNR
jgi:hypothetical protein